MVKDRIIACEGNRIWGAGASGMERKSRPRESFDFHGVHTCFIMRQCMTGDLEICLLDV